MMSKKLLFHLNVQGRIYQINMKHEWMNENVYMEHKNFPTKTCVYKVPGVSTQLADANRIYNKFM